MKYVKFNVNNFESDVDGEYAIALLGLLASGIISEFNSRPLI